MRPKLDWRAVLSAGALCSAYHLRGHHAHARVRTRHPGRHTHRHGRQGRGEDRRLNVRAGRRAVVRGRIQPAGSTVALQVIRDGRWVTLDRDRTDAQGRYVLRDRMGAR